jgi:small subunit ribosomal protein S24e
MKIEILSEKENKPLARKEIIFRVDHSGAKTPSRNDIQSKIVAQFDADPAAVIIRFLNTKYGIGLTKGSACIYTNPEDMKRIELEYIVKRNEPKKKAESEE